MRGEPVRPAKLDPRFHPAIAAAAVALVALLVYANSLANGFAYDDHFVAQDYLGVNIRFYDPTEQGVEKKIKDRVLHWRSLQEKAKQDGNPKN